MDSLKCVTRGKYNVLPIAPDNKVVCGKCNKVYRRKGTLLQHIRVKHLKKLVRCPLCTVRIKNFISKSTLNSHIKSKHSAKDLTKVSGNIDESLQKLPCYVSISDQVDESIMMTMMMETNEEFSSTSETALTNMAFQTNNHFPSFANIISLKENKNFGHHVIAQCDLSVRKVVIVSNPFATVECLSSVDNCCFECGEPRNENFFKCSHCKNVLFCSKKCSRSRDHRSKCNKMFRKTDSYIVRLTTEIMKNGFYNSGDPNKFIEFVKDVLFEKKEHRDCQPPFSTYGEVLHLKGLIENDHMIMAKRVAKCLLGLNKVVNSRRKDLKRLFTHMASRHIATIKTNSSSEEVTTKKGICIRYSIHDILSRISHSCEPNVHHYYDYANTIRGITIRPIKSGEQLFISYLGLNAIR